MGTVTICVDTSMLLDSLVDGLDELEFIEFVMRIHDDYLADLWPVLTKHLLSRCFTYCPTCQVWNRDGTLNRDVDGRHCPQCGSLLIDNRGEEQFALLSYDDWKGNGK